jgi:hypothetical protein
MNPLRTAADRFALGWHATPEDNGAAMAAISTYEKKINLPPASWIWGFSGSSSAAAGFRAQLTDLKTNQSIWSSPPLFNNATGQGTDLYGLQNPLHFLSKPLLVLAPGNISVQLKNEAAVANTVQFVLWVAENRDA